MLLKLSAHISDCLEKARLSHERAGKATDPIMKQDHLDMEQNWLLLAESYKTVERVEDFLSQAQHWRQAPSDAEIESLAERMVGNSASKL